MSNIFDCIIFIFTFQVIIYGLSIDELEAKAPKVDYNNNNNLEKLLLNSNNQNPVSSNDLLKKWYSQYPLNDDDTPVPGNPSVKGLTDVAISEGVGVGYGVGSFGYQRDFGVGTGISGRSGGQLYGFGSNLFPYLPG
uniref:Uncharacterized protein n=1 Tax=Parastrongyloides trichosuri TaxID=131310 RepID=A0A0N4Z4Q9_PARTI